MRPVRRTAFLRNRLHSGGQLQRFVMQVSLRKQPSASQILWRVDDARARQLELVVVLVL